MKTLYVDAGYTWQDTARTAENAPIIGRICVNDGESFSRSEKVGVGQVPDLKQYNNIFELIAIARAIELAIEMGWVGSLQIFTDSKIAMYWASNGIKNEKIKTVAHENAYEYVRTARKTYGGIISFNYVPRENNHAGIVLERELELDKEARRTARATAEAESVGIQRGNITIDPHEQLENETTEKST